VGQGALGVECREDDAEVRALLASIHDADTATCVAAERGVLVALQGDCKTPLAAHAERRGERLRLRAFAANPDGTAMRRGEREAAWPAREEDARALGLDLGAELRTAHA
jgi:hydroxymethylbilane synthase